MADRNTNGRRMFNGSDESAADPPRAYYKRQRTALACKSCRTRKTRCDGSRPRCAMCIEMGLECLYEQPASVPEKNSTSSSAIQDRLENIEEKLKLLMEENHSLQQSQADPVKSHSQHAKPTSHAIRAQLEVNVNGGNGANSLNGREDMQAPVSFDDTVDGMAAITFSDEHSSGFFGPSSNIAFIDQISRAVAARVSTAPSQSRPSSRGDVTVLDVSRPASPPLSANSRSKIDICALPPEEEILHLVEVFFSDTGMLYPYIHKEGLLQALATAKRNNFRSVRRSFLCLLNMIFAFATCVSATRHLPVEVCAANADVFFKRAYALAGNMAFTFGNLEDVQFLLLMTQYLQGTQRSAQTWNLLGLTVTAALRLGLHSTTASSNLSPLEQEIRKRTWYGCLMLDRILSMTFGRPSALLKQSVWLEEPLAYDLDIIGRTPQTSTPTNVPDAPSTVSLFACTIKLYEILGQTIDELYGQNNGCGDPLSLSTTLRTVIKLETGLVKWRRQLPNELLLQAGSPPAMGNEQAHIFERLSIIMTLRYLNTRVLLHRPVLTHFLRHTYDSDPELEGNDFLLQCGRNSLQVCIDSAVEVIATMETAVTRPYMLGAWWFSLYYTFNAALTVFAGLLIRVHDGRAGDDPAQAALKRSLDLAVTALQNLGDGVRLAKRCSRYLEALSKVASSLTLNPFAHLQATNPLLHDPNATMNQFPQPSGLSGSDEAGLTPLGIGLGEFLTEDNLDFMTGLVGNSQVNFNFPVQNY